LSCRNASLANGEYISLQHIRTRLYAEPPGHHIAAHCARLKR
jgi:hypothetical protein